MSQQSILVVEDEAIIAADVQARLRELGYEVAGWATTGEDALAQVRSKRPALVLMDIRLGGAMDGVETAREIARAHATPVVFLTGFADDQTLTRAKRTGPFGYIVKPFSERDLRSAIEVALYKHEVESLLRQREEQLSHLNRELDERSGFLNMLFESVPCAVLVVGPQRRITMVNRHFRRKFNLADDRALERPVGEVLGCTTALAEPGRCGSLDNCEECGINTPILAALEGRSTVRQQCQFERGAGGRVGELTLACSAAPLEHRGQRSAVLILEDITELTGLRQLLGSHDSFAGIVGASPAMMQVFNTIREVADLDVPVMILGESGTGKELVARAIHDRGGRADGRFVPVNCGALPDGLLESELFGHVKGAFTGAVRDRKGRFEVAQGGTIFLDEIGDLSPAMQVKLLRVLQERTFEKVGSDRTLTTDARVVCATHKDLEAEVSAGRFRHDLYYRLCVVPLKIPPLRHRVEDVPLLARHLVEKESATGGGRKVTLSSEVIDRFLDYGWPGNVRELQNALTYAFIKCKDGTIRPEHLPPTLPAAAGTAPPSAGARSGLSPEAVRHAVVAAGGNRLRAAKALGVSRATLYRFLDRHPGLLDGV